MDGVVLLERAASLWSCRILRAVSVTSADGSERGVSGSSVATDCRHGVDRLLWCDAQIFEWWCEFLKGQFGVLKSLFVGLGWSSYFALYNKSTRQSAGTREVPWTFPKSGPPQFIWRELKGLQLMDWKRINSGGAKMLQDAKLIESLVWSPVRLWSRITLQLCE